VVATTTHPPLLAVTIGVVVVKTRGVVSICAASLLPSLLSSLPYETPADADAVTFRRRRRREAAEEEGTNNPPRRRRRRRRSRRRPYRQERPRQRRSRRRQHPRSSPAMRR